MFTGKRILHAMQQQGLPQPVFQNFTDGFMVTIFDAQYSAAKTTFLKPVLVFSKI
jgi:hypothetical protein